jgi:hypothetical protein
MDIDPPATPKRPRGKWQWHIIEKLRRAKGQSLVMPKGTTPKTMSEVRAIRALESKGIVIVMGDRYARIR